MTRSQSSLALDAATTAAREVGEVMRRHRLRPKRVNAALKHDIKLELDVLCQRRIERRLRREFPSIPILGEEGILGNPQAEHRWVVDPIDGTVNFTYGIPHACVSIALQSRSSGSPAGGRRSKAGDYATVLGVVYDPFTDELWTAVRGGPARLNGRRIQASRRARLGEAIVSIGFAKRGFSLNRMLPTFNGLIHRVRKIRIMGAAALALTYVASGRVDAYIEYGLRLWDIAAGGLILECANGEFWHREVSGAADYTYSIIANNGRLRSKLNPWITQD